MTTAEQVRSYAGPAILSYGFRPFFLAGAVWAVMTMLLWLAMLSGHLDLPSAFSPIEWHAHELIYGYVPAIVAGFLLTAVPNWTKRLPVAGTPLLVLFLVWLAGRLTVMCSLWVGPGMAALVDLLFLAALAGVMAREIIAARNARNLKVLVAVGLLLVGNALFHAEVLFSVDPARGTRIGVSATLLLIMIVGGRIVPSFTRNWLAKQKPGRLPVAFNRVDVAIVLVSVAALISWVVLPEQVVTAALALAAGLLNSYRLARWAGERTVGEPLVLVLHAAYAFVGLGFILLSLSIWREDVLSTSAPLHAWTAGAIGVMTLAVMTRASLGHCGQSLTARWPTQAIYGAAIVAACTRIAAAFDPTATALLHVSAMAWLLAFTGFVLFYAPLLSRRSR